MIVPLYSKQTCLSYLILLLLLFLIIFNYNFFFNLFFSDRGPPGGQEAPSARLYRLCLGPALTLSLPCVWKGLYKKSCLALPCLNQTHVLHRHLVAVRVFASIWVGVIQLHLRWTWNWNRHTLCSSFTHSQTSSIHI